MSVPPDTVLVVDDDPAILNLIEMVLDEEGYTVKTAANGREALNQMRDAIPKMVLLDLMMPVMDGWSFCRVAKGSPEMQGVPIVVMSADRHLQQKADDVQADGYLLKPFDIDQLLATVLRYTRAT